MLLCVALASVAEQLSQAGHLETGFSTIIPASCRHTLLLRCPTRRASYAVVVQVPVDASDADIKKAYRKLSLQVQFVCSVVLLSLCTGMPAGCWLSAHGGLHGSRQDAALKSVPRGSIESGALQALAGQCWVG